MDEKLTDIIFDALTENYKDKIDKNKDLKEYLQEKTKNELLSIYLSYGFSGNVEDIVEQISTLQNKKKEESIKSIIEFLNKDFSKIFRFLNKNRFDETRYIAKEEGVLEFKTGKKNKVSFGTIKILEQLGFIFCKKDKDKVVFHMPNFIRDKIRNSDKCLYLDLYQDIIEYSIGIADTYGVIHIIDAYDIIKRDIEISFEEYEAIVKFFSLLELEPILYSFKRQAICNYNLDDEEIDKFLLENNQDEYVVYNKEFYKRKVLYENIDKTKVVRRHIHEEWNEIFKENRLSKEGKELYQKRKEHVERSFADSKQNHGYRYAMYKGVKKNQHYTWLICAAQNMKNIAIKNDNVGKNPLTLSSILYSFIKILKKS